MRLDVVRLFGLANGAVAHLPEPLGQALFAAAADVAWAAHGDGVRQLERNLARLRPGLGRRALRRLSRAGMRSYLRYYYEVFRLPRLTPDQIRARVRTVGADPVRADLAEGSVVCALGHAGNWDLAGAWASYELGEVLTVAEHLEPEELFRGFLDFRQGLGMTIVPLEKGGSTFRTLLRRARGQTFITPLLADRDLSRTGVDVDLAGHRARVAAGPAALALAIARPLYAVGIRHERLTGARQRAAGSRWGIVVEFSAPLLADGERPAVGDLTQRWVDFLGAFVRAHPTDWHMLQKVFLADLDPARLAPAAASAGSGDRAGGPAPGGGSGDPATPPAPGGVVGDPATPPAPGAVVGDPATPPAPGAVGRTADPARGDGTA
ncbi:phosphatidylinositol mannoside acyltransferase [Georgenia sp. TF02-10]|uniref:phosphatidylinositol mannoside acyltransferase n=1 Tax=Georgenia sp. TF02-10 TaxID=2917725 RepID=UPI00352C0A9E